MLTAAPGAGRRRAPQPLAASPAGSSGLASRRGRCDAAVTPAQDRAAPGAPAQAWGPCARGRASRRCSEPAARPEARPRAVAAREERSRFPGTSVSKHGSQPRSRIINYGNSCLNESDSWRSTTH